MIRSTKAILAATSLLTLVACGEDDSPTRVQLVADACRFDVADVPPEKDWTVGDYGETPTMDLELGDGRAATIETTEGTTLDNLDENLRIEWITCYEDDGNDEEDLVSTVTWSPDGKTFTVDTEEILNSNDPVPSPIEPEETAESTEPLEPTATTAEPVETEVSGVDGPIREFTGDHLTAEDIVEYVVSSGVVPEATTSNLGCSDGPHVDGDTATCFVDAAPYPFTILASVHITSRGMWITLANH